MKETPKWFIVPATIICVWAVVEIGLILLGAW
jgi:hypothetical protein